MVLEYKPLRKTADFKRVYAEKNSLYADVLVMFFRENGLDHARFGTAVSKKHGKAVRRNRLKRMLREAWRASAELFPSGFDYVLIPKKSGTIKTTKDFFPGLKKMAKRFSHD